MGREALSRRENWQEKARGWDVWDNEVKSDIDFEALEGDGIR